MVILLMGVPTRPDGAGQKECVVDKRCRKKRIQARKEKGAEAPGSDQS
jgi:hypothetical protein